MNKQTITIKENGCQLSDVRSMILNLIDCQINNYKLKLVSDWEKCHTQDSKDQKEKIKALISRKKDLIEMLNNDFTSTEDIDFEVSFEISPKKKSTNTQIESERWMPAFA